MLSLKEDRVDAFRTADETAFRRRARDYFRCQDGPRRSASTAAPERIWRDLEGARGPDGPAASPRGVSLIGLVAIIEEAACHAPRLGHDLLAWRAASEPLGRIEGRLCLIGRLAGTAAHVIETGTRAARERGAFASSLMGCREIQESLAGLVAGAELLRLGTCRVCRLLDRGERARAEAESALLHGRAVVLARDVRAVALSLLGERWAEANLPADDRPSGSERKKR